MALSLLLDETGDAAAAIALYREVPPGDRANPATTRSLRRLLMR